MFCLLIVIDLVCIFTINRPLFALKLKTPYAYSGILYDVYACPEYTLPQIKAKGTKFGCAVLNKKVSSYTVSELSSVSIRIDNISNDGATIIITDTNKNVYGEWYVIEKLDNGNWYTINTIIENYGFNDMGYLVDENNEVKFEIDWEWLYGNLSSGTYRLLKQVNNSYIAVQFEI